MSQFSPIVFQLLVHPQDVQPHQDVGGRPHELRGSGHELPHLQRHRETAAQSHPAQEVQVPRVLQHHLRRPHPHGGTLGVCHRLRGGVRDDAAEDSPIPCRPCTLQR